jgi:Cdc6-like AAA superfamily ATPase
MTDSTKDLVLKKFQSRGIDVVTVSERKFPGETIVVVEVSNKYQEALEVASELDASIEHGFVTVKRAQANSGGNKHRVTSVRDERVTSLIEMLNSRSRTSESRPSLGYVADATEQLRVAVTPRNHLVFGRRGAGKTALLLEAKRVVEERGDRVIWMNVQTIRSLAAARAFLTVGVRLCELIDNVGDRRTGRSSEVARALRDRVVVALNAPTVDGDQLGIISAQLQQLIGMACTEAQCAIYVFLDDIHYMRPNEVPEFLDLVHGVTRDNDAWLKVAGIKHQTRWFSGSPPVGLQTGHDAAVINLDVTLEEPAKARIFLDNILKVYIEASGARPVRGFLSASAVDRLVLASGGVPRDFMELCAGAIQSARQRQGAKYTGAQDVNNAAGLAARAKLQELEDDAASMTTSEAPIVMALNAVREFMLNEQQITYLRIDFRDKETHGKEYAMIQSLMDLRMLHLINSSLSDEHRAGQRSEVYLLDLSQYSGIRLKQHIRVLDFEGDHLVLKRTRTNAAPQPGDTPKKLIGILRRGPIYELKALTAIASGYRPFASAGLSS